MIQVLIYVLYLVVSVLECWLTLCLMCRMCRIMVHCMFTYISSRLETLQTQLMRTMKEDLLSTEVGVSLFDKGQF